MPLSQPQKPKAYHITHINNILSIATSGYLYSDAYRIRHNLNNENIGITGIKESRLTRLVSCNPDTSVGDYVPFYFCPRSVMLYILHMGNHEQLTYHGGQTPIAHLQFDVNSLAEWASENGHPWAFSDRNAATRYAEFYNKLDDLDQINWTAVSARDFRQTDIKDAKQAEFLVYERVPWHMIEGIGVFDNYHKDLVANILKAIEYPPPIAVKRNWYY